MERGEKKGLGAYYTPAPLARILVRWAIRSPRDRVLDPSCGDGAFLREAVREVPMGCVVGVELDPEAARKAAGIPRVRIWQGNFLDFEGRGYDCVVGNPPFVRYQRFEDRHRVGDILRRAGFRLPGLSSAWAPFALLAARCLRDGGRMSILVPREALSTNYGRLALAQLSARFESFSVEPLEPFWFEGALVKVAWVRGSGYRPAGRPKVIPDWRLSELTPGEREIWRRLSERFVPLSELAQVRLGIVTGDKRFFVPTREDRRRHRIPEGRTVPVLTGPGQISGCRVLPSDLERIDRKGGRVRLVAELPAAYVREGVRRGVDRKYKCRIRNPWWRVPLGPVPDGFLSYLVDVEPRMAANGCGARATNNLHVVFLRDRADAGLFAAFHNPLTRLSIELLGRVYGGGVLKIEPGDAARILVPPPRYPERLLEAADRRLRAGRRPPLSWIGLRRVELERLAGAAERLAESRRASRHALRVRLDTPRQLG